MTKKWGITLLFLTLLCWGIFVFIYDVYRVETQKVIFLNTTDMHGDFERERTKHTMIDFVQYVAEFKAKNPHQVISIDCGDFSNGSPEVALTHGRFAAQAMSEGNYDVMVLGNHEFDYGIDTLINHMQMMKQTHFLSANVKILGDSNIKPYHVFERMGKKIAIIGLMTPAFAEESFWSVHDWRLSVDTNIVVVLEKVMRHIQPLHVDAVVVAMHAGVFSNYKMLYKLVTQFPEIEFYFGGHSHEMVLNSQLAQEITFSQASHRCKALIKSILQLKRSRNSICYKKEKVVADSRRDLAYEIPQMNNMLANFQDSRWDFLFDGKAPYFVMQNLIFETLKSSLACDVSWVSERGFYDFKRKEMRVKTLYSLFPYNNRLILIQLKLSDLEQVFLKIDGRKLTKNHPKDLRGLRAVRRGLPRRGHYDFVDSKGNIRPKNELVLLATSSYQLNSIRPFAHYVREGIENKTIKCQFLNQFLTDEIAKYLSKNRE